MSLQRYSYKSFIRGQKFLSTFWQNDSVLPSLQEINQNAIKIYFQLLKFSSSLADFYHINQISNSNLC